MRQTVHGASACLAGHMHPGREDEAASGNARAQLSSRIRFSASQPVRTLFQPVTEPPRVSTRP